VADDVARERALSIGRSTLFMRCSTLSMRGSMRVIGRSILEGTTCENGPPWTSISPPTTS
jgi:hypothetical protein